VLPVRASVRLRLLVEAHLRGPAVGSALGGCASPSRRAHRRMHACASSRAAAGPAARKRLCGCPVLARFSSGHLRPWRQSSLLGETPGLRLGLPALARPVASSRRSLAFLLRFTKRIVYESHSLILCAKLVVFFWFFVCVFLFLFFCF
jgi:hypothetical protein